MVSETLATITRPAPLPIWATAADTYRHLWRHRWTYLGQLFIWAILMWAARIPTEAAIGLINFAGLDWTVSNVDLTGFALDLTVSILCLLAGGGLTFLSCGRAIMFGRKPRIGDAVRPFRLGNFWRYLVVYWFIVNLVPTVFAQGLRQYALIEPIDEFWVDYYGVLAVYWAWTMATAPLVVLALPIAAFEAPSAPLREAWARLRGNRLRLAALCPLAAIPVVGVEIIYDVGFEPFVTLIYANDWPLLFQYVVVTLVSAPIRGTLSFLLILVLGATVISAYTRLSPRFEHVARVFD